MRRLVLLTAVCVMAVAGVAYAVTSTLDYSAKLTYKGKPTGKRPKALQYTGTLHIDTDPQGQQPEIAPITTIFFSKAIKNNARYFPFCNQSEIDGNADFPAKCLKAVIGSGSATAYAGQPGASLENSVKEDLSVRAVNGPRGKKIFLVVNSEPGAPVAVPNRVIPGSVARSAGTFGFRVRFEIPEDLQTQLGLSISLTDFNVKIIRKYKRVKGKRRSYLELTSCRRHLPVKAVSQFKDSDTGDLKTVTDTSSAKC